MRTTMNPTFAQTIILDRINKKSISFANNSYDVYGDLYGDSYIDEPYGDYYDTNSEEPN